MAIFILALMAAAACGWGGSEAVRVARLSAALGTSAWIVLACWTACIAACMLAAQAGGAIATRLDPDDRAIAAAPALLGAALDLAVRRPGKPPAEPTRSFGAIALVLGTGQLASASGLAAFALAVVSGAPLLAASGGALGAGGVLTYAWLAGARWEAQPLLPIARFGGSVLLLAAAAALGLSAMDMAR